MSISVPTHDLPATIQDVLPLLRAADEVPAICVVENDSIERNRLFTEIASDALSRGEQVIVAQQSPHDIFGVPTVPEYLAVRQALDAVRNSAPLWFFLPRLEVPLASTIRLLRQLRQAPGAYAVVGAATLATGLTHCFDPAWCPCSFPLLWMDGYVSGREHIHLLSGRAA